MEFRDNEAIYLQIAAFVCDNILTGKWPAGQKILSVRDLAVALEVNPNTVMRTYEYLQQRDIISNKRGMGLFVTANAVENIKSIRRERFMQQELPDFFTSLYLLDIEPEEVMKLYNEFKKTLSNK